MPLGLAPNQHYAAVSGSLATHQTLVLMSDGVVEARNAEGELLGFERVAPITLQPAQQIAAIAKTFGQEDDLTVLTLTRLAVGTEPTRAL